MDAHQLAPLSQIIYEQEDQLQESWHQASDNEGNKKWKNIMPIWEAGSVKIFKENLDWINYCFANILQNYSKIDKTV